MGRMTFDGRPDVMIFTCACFETLSNDEWGLCLACAPGQSFPVSSTQWQAIDGT